MRGRGENIFCSLGPTWIRPYGHNCTGRLLIQQATLPLSLFPPLLLYPLSKYKDIPNPLPSAQNQCMIAKTEERLQAKKDTHQRVAFLFESFQTVKDWCDQINGAPVTLYGELTVVTCPHHFLLRLWSSNNILDLLHLFNFKHLNASKSMCMCNETLLGWK